MNLRHILDDPGQSASIQVINILTLIKTYLHGKTLKETRMNSWGLSGSSRYFNKVEIGFQYKTFKI